MFAVSLAFFLYSYLVRFGRPAAGPGVLVPVVIDAALFTLFALHHSLFARPLVKRWLFSAGVRPRSDRGQTGVGPRSERDQTGVGPWSDLGQTGVGAGSDQGQT